MKNGNKTSNTKCQIVCDSKRAINAFLAGETDCMVFKEGVESVVIFFLISMSYFSESYKCNRFEISRTLYKELKGISWSETHLKAVDLIY